jgi:Bacterial protein of unknown function (DUF948)
VSAAELAALIAAGFFAVGVCALVFVLLRLAGLISRANRILTDYSGRASALIEQAQAAVGRTNEQLARTDSITASMDEVTANMAELSGHVSALAGLARGISAGLGAPLLRVAAFAFGVRRAISLRRAPGAAAMRNQGVLASREAAARPVPDPRTAGRNALPAGRGAPTGRARLRGGMPRQRIASDSAGREEARR